MITFLTVGTHKDMCSISVRSCITPFICNAGICDCETLQYYNENDNTCNIREFLLSSMKLFIICQILDSFLYHLDFDSCTFYDFNWISKLIIFKSSIVLCQKGMKHFVKL